MLGVSPNTAASFLERPARCQRHQYADEGAQSNVEVVRIREDESRVNSCRSGEHASADAQGGWAEARSEPAVEGDVKGPGDHSSDDHGEDAIHIGTIHRMLAAQDLLTSEVENAVGSQGGSGSVVQIKEPDRAVNDGEPQRQQRIHGADGEAVESELQGLVRGLADFPADVGRDEGDQYDREQLAPVGEVAKQLGRSRRSQWALTALWIRRIALSDHPLDVGEAPLVTPWVFWQRDRGYSAGALPNTRYPWLSGVLSAGGRTSTTTLARPTTSPSWSKL